MCYVASENLMEPSAKKVYFSNAISKTQVKLILLSKKVAEFRFGGSLAFSPQAYLARSADLNGWLAFNPRSAWASLQICMGLGFWVLGFRVPKTKGVPKTKVMNTVHSIATPRRRKCWKS